MCLSLVLYHTKVRRQKNEIIKIITIDNGIRTSVGGM